MTTGAGASAGRLVRSRNFMRPCGVCVWPSTWQPVKAPGLAGARLRWIRRVISDRIEIGAHALPGR
eukprot:3151643-Prymnesium_polylepis.1